MVEFFESISKWFMDNRTSITTCLSGGSLLGVLTSIFVIIKQRRSQKKSDAELKSALSEFAKTSSLVSMIKDVYMLCVQTAKRERIASDNQKQLFEKLDNMIKAQKVVYSRLKDGESRAMVEAYLAKAQDLLCTVDNELVAEPIAEAEEPEPAEENVIEETPAEIVRRV